MEIKKNLDGTKLEMAVSGRLDTNTAPQFETELKNSLNGVTDLTLQPGCGSCSQPRNR